MQGQIEQQETQKTQKRDIPDVAPTIVQTTNEHYVKKHWHLCRCLVMEGQICYFT